MTWKNKRTLVVCYIELFASFCSHQCIKTWVTVHKYTIWVKIINYLSHVSLKFFRRPWKTIGHHLYATSSFVHHLTDVSELKLELQSGNAHWGQNRWFLSHVALQFDRWHWKTIGHLFYATSSFVRHFVAIVGFELELQCGNAKFG